jgi:hypothetical protein
LIGKAAERFQETEGIDPRPDRAGRDFEAGLADILADREVVNLNWLP